MSNIGWALLPSLYYATNLFRGNKITLPESSTAISPLSEQINAYVHSLGIKQETFLLEDKKATYSDGALATNIGTDKITIFAEKSLLDTDPSAFYFALNHEIGHIVHQDQKKDSVIKLIMSLAYGILLGYFLPPYFSLPLTIFLNYSASKIRSPRMEQKADSWAIEHSNIEELKGGLRFFKIQQAIMHIFQTSKKQKELLEIIKKNQDSSLTIDPFHPKISQRIELIEKALQERGIDPKFQAIDWMNTNSLIQNYFFNFLSKSNPERTVSTEEKKALSDLIFEACLFKAYTKKIK